MSSSDEGCSGTMPDLVDPCPHHDSSSDKDSLDITIENKAKATRRSTRIPPTVLLPSYFKEDKDGNDDNGEVYDEMKMKRYLLILLHLAPIELQMSLLLLY
jgi:hypothetical protein